MYFTFLHTTTILPISQFISTLYHYSSQPPRTSSLSNLILICLHFTSQQHGHSWPLPPPWNTGFVNTTLPWLYSHLCGYDLSFKNKKTKTPLWSPFSLLALNFLGELTQSHSLDLLCDLQICRSNCWSDIFTHQTDSTLFLNSIHHQILTFLFQKCIWNPPVPSISTAFPLIQITISS